MAVNPDASPTLSQATVSRAEKFDIFMGRKDAGKVVVDVRLGTVTVSWRGEPPADLVGEASREVDGVTVRLVDAPRSAADLRDAMADVWKLKIDGFDVVAIEPADQMDGLVVYADLSSRESVSSVEPAISTVIDLPVVVVEVGQPRMPLASRQNDTAPWQGGGRLLFASNSNKCTTGFTVVKPDGTGRILAAGHCNWGAGSRVNDGAGDMIAPAGSSVIKKNFDSLLIDPNGGTIGEVYRGAQDAPGSNEAIVSNSAAPVQGTPVCVGGAATGEHCSDIEIGNTGVQFSCGDPDDTRQCTGFAVKDTEGGVSAGTGDSGAPIYIVKSDNSLGARGIVSEGNPAYIVTCNSNVWGSPVCVSRFWAVSTETLKAEWNVVMDVE